MFWSQRAFTLTSLLVLTGAISLIESSAMAQEESRSSQPIVRSWQSSGDARMTFGGPQVAGPKVSPREFERMKTELALDELQVDLLDASYEGYRQAIRDAGEPLRTEGAPILVKRGEEGRFDRDAMMERVRKMQQLQREYREIADRIEREFLTTIQDVLTEDQARLWDSYERGMRRRLTLSDRAMLGGEGVDVVQLVEAIEIGSEYEKSVQMALDEYEIELDHALIERNRILDEIDGSISSIDPMAPGESAETMPNLMNRSTEKRLAVVRLNEKYVATISSMLDPETGIALRTAYNVASFPRIFRPTRADRYIDDILEEKDELSPAQLSSIDLIQTDYRLTLAQVNRRLLEIERQRQADMLARTAKTSTEPEPGEQRAIAFQSAGGGAMMMLDPQGNPETEAQYRDARKQKNDLVDHTIDSLYTALNADQQARLPKPESRQFLSGADLRGLFENQDFLSFNDGDLPPGVDRERLNEILRSALENIRIDFDDGELMDGDIQIHSISMPGAGENGQEGVAVAITVSGSVGDDQVAEEGEVTESTKDEKKKENGGGG